MTSPWSAPPPEGGSDWPPYQPPPQQGWSAYQAMPPREEFGVRRDLPVVVVLLLAFALVGVPAGLIWHQVSAQPVVLESAGGGFALPADMDNNYFGSDAAFFGITVLAGVATGAAGWAATRRRGPAVPVGIAVGGVIGSLVARAVGEAPVVNATLGRVCGTDVSYDSICAVYDGHLRIRSVSVLFGWALAAVGVHLFLTALVDRQRSRPVLHAPLPPWYTPVPGPLAGPGPYGPPSPTGPPGVPGTAPPPSWPSEPS